METLIQSQKEKRIFKKNALQRVLQCSTDLESENALYFMNYKHLFNYKLHTLIKDFLLQQKNSIYLLTNSYHPHDYTVNQEVLNIPF